MKKYLMLFVLLAVTVLAIGQTTDSTAVVTYNFGDSLLEFLKQNAYTLAFVLLFFISEWMGETDKIPEGSIWRKIVNFLLNIVKKKATESPKMKKMKMSKVSKLLIVAVLLSAFAVSASAQGKYRWYPFHKEVALTADASADMPVYSKDSTLYFAPAASFDIFTLGATTGNKSVGAIPGIGYNIIYNPFLWDKYYLAGFGLFASAALDETNPDIFTFELTPVISVLNWIKIGYGYQWNFGGQNEWVLRLGIIKSL